MMLLVLVSFSTFGVDRLWSTDNTTRVCDGSITVLALVKLESTDDLRLVSAPLPLLAIDFFRLAAAALPLRLPPLAKLCFRTGTIGGLFVIAGSALEFTIAVTT